MMKPKIKSEMDLTTKSKKSGNKPASSVRAIKKVTEKSVGNHQVHDFENL